jgi:hypothetical protein
LLPAAGRARSPARPGRNYFLAEGPTRSRDPCRPPLAKSPLARGRTWFLASEIDFDSTLIGGSIDLVEALLGSADLDSWALSPTDSL